ncbi:MAG: peptidase, partial [Pirellulales bacterium]|nr:peptidase [Pirellulales bacterium]
MAQPGLLLNRPFLIGVATLALALLDLFGLSASAEENRPPRKFNHGVVIRFDGMITSMREQYLYRKLEEAKRRGADLVVLEIDSPGGQLQESLAIAQKLGALDWAYTVAYVPREALSGAAIAALGANEIVMGPKARMGDAGPIFLAEDFLFRHAPEKIRSDLARQMRDLAEARGRAPALAEAMVDMDLVVYHVKNKQTGKEAYLSDHEIQASDRPDDWEKIKPVLESREGHFLEVNGRRAVELGLAEATASSREEVARRYGLDGNLPVLEATFVDTAVYELNRPLVTGLLFVVGLVALYIEFSAPGISIGGLTAGLCFTLFFWSRFMGGTAGWLEV